MCCTQHPTAQVYDQHTVWDASTWCQCLCIEHMQLLTVLFDRVNCAQIKAENTLVSLTNTLKIARHHAMCVPVTLQYRVLAPRPCKPSSRPRTRCGRVYAVAEDVSTPMPGTHDALQLGLAHTPLVHAQSLEQPPSSEKPRKPRWRLASTWMDQDCAHHKARYHSWTT